MMHLCSLDICFWKVAGGSIVWTIVFMYFVNIPLKDSELMEFECGYP